MSSLSERLPSKNKSFTTAQILTVTELLDHGSALSLPNFSVRTTGILVSHDVAGNFIRIRDPLWSKDQKSPKRKDHVDKTIHEKHYSYSTPLLTKPKQPVRQNEESSNQNNLIIEFKTPNSKEMITPRQSSTSSSSTTVHNPYLRNLSSTKRTLGYGRKLGGTNNSSTKVIRKIVSIKKKQHTSLLERTKKNLFTTTRSLPSSKKLNVSCDANASKSNLFTPRSKQGRISTPRASHSPSFADTVIVDVSSVSPLSNVRIGDLIMIMGSTRIIIDASNNEKKDTTNEMKENNVVLSDDNFLNSDENIFPKNDIDTPNSKLKQAILQRTKQKTYKHEKTDFTHDEKNRNEGTVEELSVEGGYLAARIIKNVNGTNMSLLNQALLLRRQYCGL